jgi:SAM-dependent methyltransferase
MQDNKNKYSRFSDFLIKNFEALSLQKVVVSNARNKNGDLKNISIKPVAIKGIMQLSFVYHYATKDITKNHELDEALKLIESLTTHEFQQVDVFTNSGDLFLKFNKKNEITITEKKAIGTKEINLNHNKEKVSHLSVNPGNYLFQLGIFNQNGQVRPQMQDKFRQINKYVEIIKNVLGEVQLPESFNVLDMGCGKGYLTFALYDYLSANIKKLFQIIGVEQRQELVTASNEIAIRSGFEKLSFECGTILDYKKHRPNILIALHACDTATDDAIFQGISQKAEIIMVAPCCHKQIRKQLAPTNILKEITKYGIFAERQAEMLTDDIRAMLLELQGYSVKIMEFIPAEHTPKNILLVATKKKNKSIDKTAIETKLNELKKTFGIEYHYLEKLLEKGIE